MGECFQVTYDQHHGLFQIVNKVHSLARALELDLLVENDLQAINTWHCDGDQGHCQPNVVSDLARVIQEQAKKLMTLLADIGSQHIQELARAGTAFDRVVD